MVAGNNLYERALVLLRSLSGPTGIRASFSSTANYSAVFTRDAVMAGVAGLLVDDSTISDGLVRTLTNLRDLQGSEGQIASNFDRKPDGSARVSFGTLAPRIDSTTWYLVGVAVGARAGALDPAAFRDSVRAVVRLLDALEYNGRHLIYVPTGGNWADEYIYDGYILSDQVLRAWSLRMLATTYEVSAWREKAHHIERTIEERYWPPDGSTRRYPIAAFSPIMTRDVFDLAACSLLAVAGLVPRLTAMALDWIDERFLERAELPPAFHPVIDESHADWPALRRYHLHEFRNRPHEYHNGGVWPIWLGWLALGLAGSGRSDALERLRHAVAGRIANRATFAFDEYLHGITSEPGGVTQMAYTATGLVFLANAGADRQRQLLGP